jgi:hypothetical protein
VQGTRTENKDFIALQRRLGSIQILPTSALMIPFKLSFSAFTLQHSKATILMCSQPTHCQHYKKKKWERKRKRKKMVYDVFQKTVSL